MSSATLSAPSFASLSFDEKLDRLAEVAVRVGLGLREGQEMLLSAPIEALPLVRRIVDHAYRAGALLVTTFYGDDPAVLSNLAHTYARSGKREEALKVVAQMHELARQRYVPAYGFAVAYAALGEKDQALQWLEQSLQDRAWEITYLKVDPQMEILHSDPRYIDLVKRVGL